MRGDPVPFTDNAVRYVSGSRIQGDTAFALAFEDSAISIHWPESADGGQDLRVDGARGLPRRKSRR